MSYLSNYNSEYFRFAPNGRVNNMDASIFTSEYKLDIEYKLTHMNERDRTKLERQIAINWKILQENIIARDIFNGLDMDSYLSQFVVGVRVFESVVKETIRFFRPSNLLYDDDEIPNIAILTSSAGAYFCQRS